MKKCLFLLFLLFSTIQYGQSVSKTHIIYEYKDQIIMDNGKQFQILTETPFYEVSDTTIDKFIQIGDHVLSLNRILTIKSDNDEYLELIEWSTDDMKFYEYREIGNFNPKESNISNSQLPIKY